MSLPLEDKSYRSKNDMLGDIVVLLGGRVAEKLKLGDISTGASNDIERASSIARNMVTRYGMSDELGPIMFGSANHEVFLGKDYGSVRNYSETVASDIDSEVKKIITSSYDKCAQILTDHDDKLVLVAEYLIKHEKVDADIFTKLMDGTYVEPTEEAVVPEVIEETTETTEE